MKKTSLLFFLLFSIVLCAQNFPPKRFQAKVIGVKDGDTVEVLWENTPYVIRLLHIDCPEKKQDFGAKAKQELSKWIFGKTITLEWKSKDRNKRLLAVIYLDNKNINKMLVDNGLAWHYKKYSSDIIYAIAEVDARNKKLNIWSVKNSVAPWDFRKMKRSK